MPSISRALTIPEYQALLSGVPKYCAAETFKIGGKVYAASDVVALITSILDASNAAAPAKATWLAALKAIEAAEATDGETVKEIRQVIGLMFKNEPSTLAELAIPEKKARRALTSDELLEAQAKAKATRAARGTMSKKQKSKIKGNVTGVTVVPIVDG